MLISCITYVLDKLTKFIVSSLTFMKHFLVFLIILIVFTPTYLKVIQSIFGALAPVLGTQLGFAITYSQMNNGFWG